MKKVLVFFTVFIVTISAKAQFFAGIETKMGISNIVTTDSWDNGFSYFAGLNVGYEFLKHIPVSVGVEYGELKYRPFDYQFKQTGVRIPLKIGYCHYLNNLKPFINAGVFYAVKNDIVPNIDVYDNTGGFLGPATYTNHFGYLVQIGIGYKIIDKYTVSIAGEYNRPFGDRIKYNIEQVKGPGFYHLGAVIGVSISF
ncbi:MAG: PorT family protein [Prevotellaceae bacterium]|jgi:outer membrane protein W|nr:PorT family protein [Prevotellaceae bacterium]